jgi:protease secretion system membrane fusion protein
MALQRQLLVSRQWRCRTNWRRDENIAGLKLQIQGLEESRESKKDADWLS